MKRSRPTSPTPTDSTSSSHPDQKEASSGILTTSVDMACPHLSAAFSLLAPPRPSQQVHKEECTLCFDDQDGVHGIDVCLLCFNGGCTANGDREHSRLHFEKTQHSLVVNIRRVPKPKPKAADGQDDAVPPAPKKLAIAAETESDKYERITTPRCLACDAAGPGKVLPRTEKLEEVIQGILSAMSSAQQNEVKAWEEEIIACQHTQQLVQPGEPTQLDLSKLASCNQCDLTSNLWLCLTCGNLGCGRAQFGGVGGNGHGLSHFEQTGHPISVKQGTITAEGSADIYCYACNDARLDPNLASHLSHFGINVMDLSKTEKSMTELQIEQNLKFDFNMTGEDGKTLQPVFGPGLTGLKNLGNSCYIASVLQTLFSLPAFQTRYNDAYRPHTLACMNAPANCFECQFTKMADGLLSGRYSVARKPEHDSPSQGRTTSAYSDVQGQDPGSETPPLFQQGIKPSMLKALIGKGHEEFSTMRQQDADEFFKYLVGVIQKENRKLLSTSAVASPSSEDPTNIFSFGLEQRLQCTECKKVRYSVEKQDAGLSLPVPVRAKVTDVSASGKAPAEGIHAPNSAQAQSQTIPSSTAATAVAQDASGGKVEYEAIQLAECLDLFTAPEELEYHCPSCTKSVIATKRTLFTSFPLVLAIQVRRFQLVNWVPTKVDVRVIVPLLETEPLILDKYLGKGKLDHEEELPEDNNADSVAAGAAGAAKEHEFNVAAMSQLTAMGFPENRCKRALLATGGEDAEAAMNWLFGHMEDPDIDDPIDLSTIQGGSTAAPSSGGGAAPDTSMLEEMGFTAAQARKALRLNNNNPEIAVGWLFENPDDVGDDETFAASASGGAQEVGPSSAASNHNEGVVGGDDKLPARYALKSFITHKGPSVHSGHYVAHVKMTNSEGFSSKQGEEEKEGWIFFNDEKVVKAPFTSMITTKPPTEMSNQEGGRQEASHTAGAEGEGEKDDLGIKGISKLAYVYFFQRL